MMYVSTRGQAPAASFEDVLLAGLAPDGGLYLPQSWPALANFEALTALPYADLAAHILARFTGENPDLAELKTLTAQAYAGFEAPDVAPVREIEPGLFLLELFHGPTLAFKDFAMQVLARLMERGLRHRNARTTIVGATSGDTGAAAVEAFRGRQDIELFILYPHGRISDVQRRQMTTAAEDNVHVLAVEGTFDDAQTIVKTLFGNEDFRTRHGLSAINSINWARIIAQAVYYFSAWAATGKSSNITFSVPTGNFGDIFAGYVAHKLGLPMKRLVVATNENDILARAFDTGRYEPRSVFATDSPSMDIQISSNFERLLFEAYGRDSAAVSTAMSDLNRSGGFDIASDKLAAIKALFSAYRVSKEDAAASMAQVFEKTGYLMDPHTAVGFVAAQKERALDPASSAPHIVLSTAHPAKFPDAVQRATGQIPALPARYVDLFTVPERYTVLPNSAEAVAAHIRANTSASSHI